VGGNSLNQKDVEKVGVGKGQEIDLINVCSGWAPCIPYPGSKKKGKEPNKELEKKIKSNHIKKTK